MRNEQTQKAAQQARQAYRLTGRALLAALKVAECRPAAGHLAQALIAYGEIGMFLTRESSYDEGFTDGEAEAHDKAMAKAAAPKVSEFWTDKEEHT